MNTQTTLLTQCGLFSGIPEDELPHALAYLHARQRRFKHGEIIIHIGDRFTHAGLVLEGVIECSYQDEAFNKFNMNHFAAGEMFGEAMACAGVEKSPMQIAAISECVIMFLDFRVLYESEGNVYQARLAGNLMRILSAKNIFLNQKVRLLSHKDLRGRIISYLHTLAPHDGVITLPFSKTALAEFLCVNRTALSRELTRMSRDGLISMNGREFTLR